MRVPHLDVFPGKYWDCAVWDCAVVPCPCHAHADTGCWFTYTRILLVEGVPELSSKRYSDFLWVTRDEMADLVKEPNVRELVAKML